MVAQNVEDSARGVFQTEKKEANTLNDKALEYQIVQQEAMQSRNLYENLLGRLKEADLVAGLRSSNITMVDQAAPPSRPAKPNVPLYIAASIFGGLFFGICAALFRDSTDTIIQDPLQLESRLARPSLRILPYHRLSARTGNGKTPSFLSLPSPNVSARTLFTNNPASRNSFIAIAEPRSAYTEAVRSLRTSFLNGSEGPAPRVILVTSSVPGEGKSMLSTNLAILLAQQGKRVLLVDSDLRTPVLQQRFNLDGEAGLSSILEEVPGADASTLAVAPLSDVPQLSVLTAGPIPSHPAELLASEKMVESLEKWRKEYDFVLLDSAPLLPVTDSAVLSGHADLSLVVARHDVTDYRALQRSCSLLADGGAHRIEIVLNAVKASTGKQYGYNSSTYYGREQRANA
jgi:capsular exopolysaccharide synthesis family protein